MSSKDSKTSKSDAISVVILLMVGVLGFTAGAITHITIGSPRGAALPEMYPLYGLAIGSTPAQAWPGPDLQLWFWVNTSLAPNVSGTFLLFWMVSNNSASFIGDGAYSELPQANAPWDRNFSWHGPEYIGTMNDTLTLTFGFTILVGDQTYSPGPFSYVGKFGPGTWSWQLASTEIK